MAQRAATASGGLICLLIALYGGLLVLLSAVIAAQRPDPTVPNGDPCCSHPDTWGEVASWGFGALSFASIDALILTVAVACFTIAGGGRPRWRTLRWIPIGAVGATAALMALMLALD
jgi:hypothetical protein